MVQCSFFVGGRFQMFLVGDLQLNLNLQCVVMKNEEEGLIDNFVEKSGGKYILNDFF
jgi:hypothetical protein